MQSVGLSQSELARRVGVSQQNIGHLLSGNAQGSKKLHIIARELRTTPSYLAGEIDDPEEGAPPPPPEPLIQHVMMPVALPSEAALALMFEGLLATIDRSAPEAELALQLAQRLPIGLAQLRDLRLGSAMPLDPSVRSASGDAVPATADLEPQQ